MYAATWGRFIALYQAASHMPAAAQAWVIVCPSSTLSLIALRISGLILPLRDRPSAIVSGLCGVMSVMGSGYRVAVLVFPCTARATGGGLAQTFFCLFSMAYRFSLCLALFSYCLAVALRLVSIHGGRIGWPHLLEGITHDRHDIRLSHRANVLSNGD